jgi:hypothetical protein
VCSSDLVDSKIFFGLRNYLLLTEPTDSFPKFKNFLGKLFSCGYCMSVWVAIPFAFLISGTIVNILGVDQFCKWMILHRVSNVLHELFSRWFNRTPWFLAIQKIDATVAPAPNIEVDDGKRQDNQ